MGATTTKLFTPQIIQEDKEVYSSLGKINIDYKTRGAGYWLWKPLIIRSALQRSPENSILIYSDAGILPTKRFDSLASELSNHDILSWKLVQKKNSIKNWTDATVTEKLSCSEEVLNSSMLIAGFLVFKNCPNSRNIVNQWLNLCLQPDLLHPDSKASYLPTPEVVWHRHDQSLLSIIAANLPHIFKVLEFQPLGTLGFSRPFIIHRRKKPASYFYIYLSSFLLGLIRKLIPLLPKSLRVQFRFFRSRGKLSERELQSHKKFF